MATPRQMCRGALGEPFKPSAFPWLRVARIDSWAMLIGGMKCGSTTLYRHLAAHPEIAGSRPKEPQYLAMPAAWRKGRAWYESCFDYDGSRHWYALDASAAYSNTHRYPHVPQRMRQLGGHVRILYVLRDPLERMRSHILHDAATPWGGDRRGAQSPSYVEASDYAAHLDAYRDHFDRQDIHVLTLDQLAANPQHSVAEACRFLGLQPATKMAGQERFNSSPPNYLQTRAWVQGLWRATPGYTLRRVLRWSTQRARHTPALRRLLLREGQLVLSTEWEKRSRDALTPSMRRLQRDWGVDVGAWGFHG